MKKFGNKPINIGKKYLLNIFIFLILSYFVFHSIYGARGIIAYFKLQSELEHAKEKLEGLRHTRLEIENSTKLLRPGSLDRDMLDEKVRSVLGVSNPEEKLFTPSSPKENNGRVDDELVTK